MIELDGAAGEGGGQILRTALALSLCTGQPLQIRRIRAQRTKPGLMRQHLACVNAAVAIGGANAVGAELGSQELRFEPGVVRAGDYVFNVGTAGSCSLVLQTVLPPLMLAAAPSRITLSGGTHNPMAPPFHFLDRCFAPLLRTLGVGIELKLQRLGFYPAGGGEFHATITPVVSGLTPFDLLVRGEAKEAYAECLAPALSPRVAERELETLGEGLQWQPEQLRTPPVRRNEGPGNALMVTLAYTHVCELVTAFGEKRVSSESVARTALCEVHAYQQAAGALGPHLADQWMLPLALAVVHSRRVAAFTCSEITDHASTNASVIEAFLPVRITLEKIASGHWRVLTTPR